MVQEGFSQPYDLWVAQRMWVGTKPHRSPLKMNAEGNGWSRFWSKNLRRYIDCDFGLVPPCRGPVAPAPMHASCGHPARPRWRMDGTLAPAAAGNAALADD